MMTKLIPLDEWADRHYAIGRPHVQTLRRWARDGKIHPAPRKHGRAYYVSPDAEYLSDEQLVQKLTRVTPTPQPG